MESPLNRPLLLPDVHTRVLQTLRHNMRRSVHAAIEGPLIIEVALHYVYRDL